MRAGLLLLLPFVLVAAEPDMALIPSGTFTMGRTKLTSDDKTSMRPQVLLDDRPEHQVTLKALYLDVREVTQGQYAAFVTVTKRQPPYHWKGGSPPAGTEKLAAYNVSWDDAKAYCESVGKRLPTEAEWERAARGGLEKADYPWGDKFDTKLARHSHNDGPGEPGRLAPNGFGLYDMAGNMAEWTADWFEREYYKKSPSRDPKGPEIGNYRIIRGGAWSDPPKRLTVFFRNWVRPSMRQPNIGFRCAKDGPTPAQQIDELLSGFQGTVTFHAKNLVTGAEHSRKPDERVRTASTIKLPILVAVAQAIQDGKARWDEELLLNQEDKRSGSGILREFSAGRKYPLRDLVHLMIVVSDNTATNLILDRFTADYVNQVMEKYGFKDTRAIRKILASGKNSPPESLGYSKFGQPEENRKYGIGVTTPREMVKLLEMIDKGEIVSPEASKEMVAILKRQQHKDGIGRHLDGYTVASKSGSLDALRSDVGLVYGATGGEKYAIAVTVDGMPATDYSPDNAGSILIGKLSALLIAQLQAPASPAQ